jgi:hypothetical protein
VQLWPRAVHRPGRVFGWCCCVHGDGGPGAEWRGVQVCIPVPSRHGARWLWERVDLLATCFDSTPPAPFPATARVACCFVCFGRGAR